MTPHAESKGSETQSERARCQSNVPADLARSPIFETGGGDGPKVLVPVTALVGLLDEPDRVYNRYVKGRRDEPTPAMVMGELEHLARRYAVERLWETYLRARTSEDLRESYTVIHSAVTDATLSCQRKYCGLGIDLDPTHAEILNRLRIEEDGRVAGASNFLRDGILGFELVRRVLPRRVEVTLQSHSLGLVGRVDAVGEFADAPGPIEYKTGCDLSPKKLRTHTLQVAAYCMLLEEESGKLSPYGEVYHTRYFEHQPVFVTNQLKRRVLELRDQFLYLCTGTNPPAAMEEVVHDE
jgi:CRISPR/Cas system-associated exonuclease Cas4 (RecB family)